MSKKVPKSRGKPGSKGGNKTRLDGRKSDGSKKLSVKVTKDKRLSLEARCKQQMSSSLLRLMDEKLYKSSAEKASLNKDEFLAYHQAYEAAREKWPVKPLDYIVKFIKKRLLTRQPGRRLTFADVGCGKEPSLKAELPRKHEVKSFDLISIHKDVIQANMEDLPLEDSSIHCAVYSLSLMAKTLGKVILEAKRVLKVGGSLLVVEVTSRFDGHEKGFANKLERIGFKKKSMTALMPNGFFTFFHFTKVDSELEYPQPRLHIELKPCVYKAR